MLSSGLCGMKQQGVITTPPPPPGWDASPSQGYNPHQFIASTYLNNWLERDNVEHNFL